MANIEKQVQELQSAAGWVQPSTTTEMLEGWREFIEECEDSYGWNIYEYDNDLSVRDQIELILGNSDLRSHPAIQYWAERVTELDPRFLELLIPVSARENKKGWWRKGVLKFAGNDYAADVARTYGVEIEVR